MTLHRLLVLVAVAALPPHRRARCREQWLADLRDCAECQVPPGRIALGALRSALTANPLEGRTMKPIGPLAIVLRRTGSSTRQVAVVAAVLVVALLLGIALLLI